MPIRNQVSFVFAQRVSVAALIACALVMAAPLDAHAYLDAGTGSMIIQIVIASVAGALLIIKTYWRKLKSLFSRTPDQDADEENSDLGSDGN